MKEFAGRHMETPVASYITKSDPGPVVHLMYHELEIPGRAIANRDPGYLKYVTSAAIFREQICWLKSIGWRAMSVSEGIHFPHPRGVVVTFDDGCESDLLAAAPLLRDAGFTATFYVTVAQLGNLNYLSRTQVCELRRQGFEIGCHSMTHAYLNELSGERLDYEIVGAKILLEQILGEQVDHFSCPGGRWTPRVAKVAQQAGFRSVSTSDVRANSRNTDHFRLHRVPVIRSTTMKEFQAICEVRGLWQQRLRDFVYTSFKAVLGNSRYDRFRSILLQNSNPFSKD